MVKLALPLRLTIPLLVILPLLAATSATGWLALRSGRKTVDVLSTELTANVAAHVADNLALYVSRPHQINQLNAAAMRQGRLDPTALPALETHFWQQLRDFASAQHIYFSTADGDLRGASRLGNDQLTLTVANADGRRQLARYLASASGQRAGLLEEQSGYDPRQRPWYTAALQADAPTWSEIYADFDSRRLGITAAQPVRAADGELLGILGVDLFFEALEGFLETLEVGKTGEAYIIERGGLLVASSQSDALLAIGGEANQRLSLSESREPLAQATANALVEEFGDLSLIGGDRQIIFQAEGQRQFLRVRPFRDAYGLDWLILVAIPERDFDAGLRAQAIWTLLLAGVTLAIAAAVGARVSRWLVTPIVRLNQAAGEIEAQDFDPASIDDLAERDDEVGEFARVFRDMALAIGDRQQTLGSQIRRLSLQGENNAAEREAVRRELTALRDRARQLQSGAPPDPHR